MIDLNNISKINWANTRISILGAGKSGIAAAALGTHIGSQIFISENSFFSFNEYFIDIRIVNNSR